MQTVPNAGHKVVKKVSQVARESITVMDDCQSVVDGVRAEAESAKRQYAGAFRIIATNLALSGTLRRQPRQQRQESPQLHRVLCCHAGLVNGTGAALLNGW